MNYCPNCGNKLNPGDAFCSSCGHPVIPQEPQQVIQQPKKKGKALAIVSIVFGALGFYPLIFVGSIVGGITSMIGLMKYDYRTLSKIGAWVSLGNFVFWVLVAILSFIQ